MYRDAANRKILEPIDWLIKAEKKTRHIGMMLHLAECDDLAEEVNRLHATILQRVDEMPIEAWDDIKEIMEKK